MMVNQFERGISLLECLIALAIIVLLLPALISFLIQTTSIINNMQASITTFSEYVFVDTIIRRDLLESNRQLGLESNSIIFHGNNSIIYKLKSRRLQRQLVGRTGRYLDTKNSYQSLTLSNNHCVELQESKSSQLMCN